MTRPDIKARDAEQALIGILLKRPEKASEVRDLVSAEDFGDDILRAIFTATMSVCATTRSADIVSVEHECARLYPTIAASTEIVECATTYYTGELVGKYCEIIVEASQRRSLRAIADDMMRLAVEPDTDISEAIESTKRRIANLIRVGGEIKTTADVLIATLEYAERVAKGEIVPSMSGFTPLDAFTGGFFPGEMTIIGARPAVGKTASGLMASTHAANEGKHVFFASAEMNDRQIGQRLFADVSNVNAMKIRRPKTLTDDDWYALGVGVNKWGALPLKYTFERNVERIIAQARRQRDRGECDMVLVDYVQLLTSTRRFDADRLRVEYISHELKALALELDVPVIALAQLNRPGRGDVSVPRLESLADSSALEKDADGVILLHRPETPDDEIFQTFPQDKGRLAALHGSGKQLIYFNVAKQRQGITAICGSIFDGAHGRFAPLNEGSVKE